MSITVPMIRGALSFVVVISVIHAFQAFDLVYVLTGSNGGPETGTYVLAIMLFQHAFAFLDFGYASALAWVMFAMLLVLTMHPAAAVPAKRGRPMTPRPSGPMARHRIAGLLGVYAGAGRDRVRVRCFRFCGRCRGR